MESFSIGPLEDLQTRLIGSTVEDFLARPDVEMIAEVTEDELLGDEDEDEDEEDIDEESDKFNRMVETWCQMLLMLAHNVARRGQTAIDGSGCRNSRSNRCGRAASDGRTDSPGF